MLPRPTADQPQNSTANPHAPESLRSVKFSSGDTNQTVPVRASELHKVCDRRVSTEEGAQGSHELVNCNPSAGTSQQIPIA
jgi:hypothetical protein